MRYREPCTILMEEHQLQFEELILKYFETGKGEILDLFA